MGEESVFGKSLARGPGMGLHKMVNIRILVLLRRQVMYGSQRRWTGGPG